MSVKPNSGAPEPPTRPQGPLLVTDVTNDSVCLEWNPPESNGGKEITKYIVQVNMMAKKDCDSKDITKYSNLPLPGNGDGYCGFVKQPER
jgi:Fibronectin type III domain